MWFAPPAARFASSSREHFQVPGDHGSYRASMLMSFHVVRAAHSSRYRSMAIKREPEHLSSTMPSAPYHHRFLVWPLNIRGGVFITRAGASSCRTIIGTLDERPEKVCLLSTGDSINRHHR